MDDKLLNVQLKKSEIEELIVAYKHIKSQQIEGSIGAKYCDRIIKRFEKGLETKQDNMK